MIFRGRQLFRLKVGLVLAGGGAKGAYQAGVIRALWDLDLIDNIDVVSGVSIGTLNALCLCMKNRDLIDQSWKSLSYSKIVTKGDGLKISDIGDLIKKITIHKGEPIVDSIDLGALGLISQKGIRDYIKEFVDVGILHKTNIDVYSCAYNVTDGHPEYFRLNDYSEEEIIAKTKELGTQLTKDYEGKNPLLIGVLKGSVPFMAELIKHIDTHVEIDFMVVSSYHGGVKSSGEVKILKDVDTNIEGRDVVFIEDIIDTGRTLKYLRDMFKYRKANSVKIATLFDKPEGRVVDIEADYVCYDVPNEFIVGFGLDYAERYRNLPYVGVLKEEVYSN